MGGTHLDVGPIADQHPNRFDQVDSDVAIPKTTKQQIERAIREFDELDRGSEEWGAWDRNGTHTYVLVFRGRRYPPKRIIERATGAPRTSFSGGEAGANRVLTDLGFEVAPIASDGPGLKPLRPGQTAWLEITTTTHGGPGWDLGEVLWSPTVTRAGQDRYALMRAVKPGDVVIHLASDAANPEGRAKRIVGWSTAASSAEEVNEGPPQPQADYENAPFYRIALKDHVPVGSPVPASQLIDDYNALLKAESKLKGSGFSLYRGEPRVAQGKYLTTCSPELYEAIRAIMNQNAAPGGDKPKAPRPSDLVRAFEAELREARLDFGPRHHELVASFIATLLAKPFAILTGLSGSGKTQLALKLGEWFGRGRSIVVPVRPDWTGPEFLLGFEDALRKEDEHGRRPWNVPLALEFMLQAAEDPTRPYLLVLDEMNLAHVERYFADVLSGMESRQPVLPNLEKSEDGWFSANAEEPRIAIPRNLFVVGTVNVDETTYMFSPKVLDRANTLEFRVATEALPVSALGLSRPGTCAPAPSDLLLGFVRLAQDDTFHRSVAAERLEAFAKGARTLHALLAEYGFEFGHRTYYEGVRLAALFSETGDWTDHDVLDLFVLQKVLPRLHGNRRRMEPLLKALATLSMSLADRAKADLDVLSTPASSADLPRSLGKIQRMLRALQANQFASFSD